MLNNVNTILAGFIIVACLLFAGFILFTDMMIADLYGTKRTIFVVIMVVYALYRAFRLYKSIQLSNNEEHED